MSAVRQHSPALDSADLDLLLSAVPGAPLSAAAKARVLSKLTAMTKLTEPQAEFHIVLASQDDWRPLRPGVRVKPLRVDLSAGTQTSLWKLDPGAALPEHGHHFEEECLIVEGSLDWNGRRYGRGDYLLARAGGHHDEFVFPDGALLLIRGELTRPLRALFA